MASSFYEHMRITRMSEFQRDSMDRLRYNLMENLNEERLSFSGDFSSRGIETAILHTIAKELLGAEVAPDIQFDRQDLRKYKSGAPFLSYEHVEPVVTEWLTGILNNTNYDIENTVIFPFGHIAKDPSVDLTRMTPEQLQAYHDGPDNLVSYSEVIEYGLSNKYEFMIVYDLFLDDRKDSSEILGSKLSTVWGYPQHITPDQARRTKCRIFCMSKTYEAISFLGNEYQNTISEHFSKPHIIEGTQTHRFAKKWWITAVKEPLGKG